MKTQIFWKWSLGASLAILPFVGGCLQDNVQPAVQTGAAITPAAEPVVYETAQAEPSNFGAEEGPAVPALTNLAEAPIQPITTNLPPPPKVALSPAAQELVKMANSGVDEKVMQAFVEKSTSTFNLSADDIIYLNDLGVPSTVVTSMMQRDQTLRAEGAAAVAASAQAFNQPPPAQVAPQAVAPQPYAAVEAPLTPPEGDVSTASFYEPLSPYGSWVYVSGYGRCWRPTVAAVNPGWEPYFDGGRWVYTDWGWYWVSDYSWGWAPFHYGRWFRHNSWGWCWAPDNVWGPSWVAWRSSDAYCGWAPLPPGAYFTVGIGLTFHGRVCRDWDACGIRPHQGHFVAWRDFHQHGLHAYAAPVHERTTIYRNTVVVNNITVNNRTVINQGVPRERVAAVSHRDVRPVAVREVGGSPGRPVSGRAEQLRGNTLTVYRPAMPQATRNTGNTTTTGAAHGRPVVGNRMSAESAPSAPSTPSAGVAGGRDMNNRPNSVQTRPGTVVTRDRQPVVTSPRTAEPLRSPGAVARETQVTPVPRLGAPAQPGPAPARVPNVSSPRSSDSGTRPPQAAPAQRQPAPAPAPSRPSNQGQPRSSSSPYTPAPTYGSTPAYTPQRAPTYTAPQRSYSAPASGPREAIAIPRQTPSAAQVPRYSPAPSRPSPSYSSPPQRSYSAPSPSTPSYSRPAPAAPSYSAPAASAPRAPAPSSSGSGNNNSRRQN